jgi:hypothetical protein
MAINQAEEDPQRLRHMYDSAVKDLTILRRSAVVNQLYGGWKLSVEVPRKPEATIERGDI